MYENTHVIWFELFIVITVISADLLGRLRITVISTDLLSRLRQRAEASSSNLYSNLGLIYPLNLQSLSHLERKHALATMHAAEPDR